MCMGVGSRQVRAGSRQVRAGPRQVSLVYHIFDIFQISHFTVAHRGRDML